MTDNGILFIAEIGNNHNGDISRGKRLIDTCVNMGCHIVKFQLRDFNSLYRQTSANVEDLGGNIQKTCSKSMSCRPIHILN